ncbi:Galactosylceramide sulfotransferase [Holothuria leucospilota]|uniref:Galactosylceramide sulfotransferase n=1 Tax=Holothuria leucospilota TaxID=206669 RepID=A0A9Q1CKZ0_HOLLE|nr:Galactosylceramide sulfotransferase [Holothuria leucospilota]
MSNSGQNSFSSLTRLLTSCLLVIGLITIWFTAFEVDIIYQDPLPKRSYTVGRNQKNYSNGLQTWLVTTASPNCTTLTLKCTPVQKIVFLKTHKTASTTTASIFERYGFYRGLKFAVGRTHVLSREKHFNRKNVLKFPLMDGTFDILCNHARYNRKEMDVVVPNATYITILRKPEDQLESAFGYFEMYEGMNITADKNAFKTFLNDPMKYYKDHKYRLWQLSRNGQLFDLVFDHTNDDNEADILAKIAQIDHDFDIVMLTEYYDESLILLKRLLCWDFEDILYFPVGIRSDSHRMAKDKDLIDKSRKWNHGDVLLYEHFTKVFWSKIEEYGPSFEKDLQKFRNLNKAAFDACISLNQTDKKDRREFRLVLKNKTDRCERIFRADVGYTKLIKKTMMKRFKKSN